MNSPQPQQSKNIGDFSDLELAEISGKLYTDLMQIQGNLQAINQEIQRRKEANVASEKVNDNPNVNKPEVKPVEEVKK